MVCSSAQERALKHTLLKPRNRLFHFPMKFYVETQHVQGMNLFGLKQEDGETLLPSPPS